MRTCISMLVATVMLLSMASVANGGNVEKGGSLINVLPDNDTRRIIDAHLVNSKVTVATEELEGKNKVVRVFQYAPTGEIEGTSAVVVDASSALDFRAYSNHGNIAVGWIEGNRLTLKETEQVIQQGKLFPGRQRDVGEVERYYKALQQVEKWVEGKQKITEEGKQQTLSNIKK